ncbi:hypothetical protein SA15R_10060, partial [Rothia kristinae]
GEEKAAKGRERNQTARRTDGQAKAREGQPEEGGHTRKGRAEQEPEYVVEDQQQEEQQPKGRKKGFFSRFLGL